MPLGGGRVKECRGNVVASRKVVPVYSRRIEAMGAIMDYGALINEAARISWRHKSLWIFGLFAGSLPSFNFSGSGDSESAFGFDPKLFDGSSRSMFPPELLDFLDQYWPVLVAAVLLFALAMIVANLISQPALIDATNKISRGGIYRFGTSFSRGIDFFWRFLGLFLIGFAISIVAILGMVLIGILTFAVHTLAGVLYLLVAIPLALFGVFALYNVFSLAQRAIVVRDSRIGDALEEGMTLFRTHMSKVFILLLIYIALLLAVVMCLGVVFLVVGIPLAAIAIADPESLLTVIVLGLLLGLPASIAIGGFSGSFIQVLYTLFYFRLVEPGGTGPIDTPGPAIGTAGPTA